MKKLSGIALLTVVTLGLAGCGPTNEGAGDSSSKGKSNKDYDLLVWEDQSKSKGIEEAVSAFEKKHDVTVKVVEKAYGNQIEDLRLDGPAGTGPDVITIPGDQIGTSVTEGLLKELSVGDEITDLYTESAMNSQIVNGKVYGLPKAVETTILYYNKALVTEDKLPKNTDEWLMYSMEVTTKDNYGLLALWDQIYYAQGVMSGYGGYVFGKDAEGNYDPSDIGLANKGAIEGAEYIQSFYEAGVLPTGLIGEQGINVLDSLFTEGKAAAVISGPWNIEPYKEAGIDYGVTALPLLGNGKPMSSFIGVKSYNVSSYSKEAELAQQFVEFISNEENSKVRYEKTQEVPAVKSLAEDPTIMASETSKAIATQSQHAELTPGITAMNSVWEPVDAALQTIATGKGKPKEALISAVEQITAAIDATKK
ncbi:extracellular solute-binding protein [uncultured Vagococcus sp.]|uniref:extracellular solute-binding protein n=1 Tax=uncultured Vagococcus sp. TaxID=189676 RepID=UPI0028D3530C|nr:extracellular solute-binding protein [uncultured Vagococcus sp.]